jgi:peptidoglycan/xylan/chitin deacetylase (PgdA/CDA1 family)
VVVGSDAPGWGGPVTEKLRALHTVPSSVAFSPVGPFVTPRLRGIGRPGHVALTFDDGPDPVGTEPIMAVLAQLGWQATFFVLADMVRRSPGLVAELVAAGHDVGVHASEHRSHRHMTPRRIRDDVRRAHATIVDAGAVPEFYRPPHGALSPEGLVTARRLGMRTVLWTAWGRDWRAEATTRSVCDDVAAGRLDGGTVLLHDSDCASAAGSWRTTLAALPRLADLFTVHDLSVGPLRDHFRHVPSRPDLRSAGTTSGPTLRLDVRGEAARTTS